VYDVLAAKPDPRGVPVYLIAEGPPDALTEALVQEAADATLRVDAAGRRWSVKPVFEESADSALGGFYEVCGRLNAATLPRAAFDAAYRLEDDLKARGVRDVRVRPDLESSIFGRAYTQTPRAEAEAEATRAALDPRWSLATINAQAAWATQPKPGGAARGQGVVVGHPDTGYTDSVELDAAALDLGRDRDFVTNDDDARDPMDPSELPEGHGTRTGSVIIGREAGRVTGIAPEARLLPLRATTSVVLVRAEGVAKAVEYAARMKCDVISMSLGGILVTNVLERAIDRAVASGTIVMAAAGNYNWAGRIAELGLLPKPVVAPARYRNCIAVGGSTQANKAWWGSARGSKILVSAPADDVFVPRLPERSPPAVGPSAGTSYGVANLAGVAALWLAHHGADSLRQKYGPGNLQQLFVHVIQKHGAKKPSGWDGGKYGVGIVDAKKVLDFPLPASLPAPRAGLEAAPASPRMMLETALGAEEPGEADERIAALLGPRTRGREDEIDRFGDEIAYLLGEHPEFLARMNQPSRGPEAASDADAARTLLLSTGSPQLVEALATE
jgi:Subtilase family